MTKDADATPDKRIPVGIDGAILRRIIDIRFPGGIAAFLDNWHCRTDARGKPYTKAPGNRATVYRWLNGDLPGSAETLLELAAVLDVDPFSMITLAGNDAPAATARILTAMETGLWQHKTMAVMKEFLGRRAEWPPPSVGMRYPNGWSTFDFTHDPAMAAGVYGSFRVSFAEHLEPDIPRMLHIAYRHAPHFGGRWLQYGMIRLDMGSALLLNINGSIEYGFAPTALGPYTIETVFGLGPAEFRLASLSPFTATGQYAPSTDSGRVGFR
ncbi:MAG: helix-turn-helix domain-containing protein [Alphaproteobacteria bacterium]|nr:helix-turn-helix domain-containing protein [Alphaproteobacteria bacterium]